MAKRTPRRPAAELEELIARTRSMIADIEAFLRQLETHFEIDPQARLHQREQLGELQVELENLQARLKVSEMS